MESACPILRCTLLGVGAVFSMRAASVGTMDGCSRWLVSVRLVDMYCDGFVSDVVAFCFSCYDVVRLPSHCALEHHSAPPKWKSLHMVARPWLCESILLIVK